MGQVLVDLTEESRSALLFGAVVRQREGEAGVLIEERSGLILNKRLDLKKNISTRKVIEL